MVWVSRQSCAHTDEHFVWVLSHEFGHLQQDLLSKTLSKAGHFLYCCLGCIEIQELKVQNTVPTELDADLRAWRTARKVLGPGIDDYVEKMGQAAKRPQSFKMLQSTGLYARYDVASETATILSKYKKELMCFQKTIRGNDHLTRFNITDAIKALQLSTS